ncbi:MAG: hypothetical protein J6N77_04395 [Lachnospiraceae bacterium]|nr:hypothetical protein [Lachnospiraceae bacterium]
MPEKMKVREVRKRLIEMDHQELVEMVVNMYRSNADTNELVNLVIGGEEYKAALLSETKSRMQKMIIPEKGRMSHLSQAKDLTLRISSLINEEALELDLFLYYVECCMELLLKWDVSSDAYEPMEDMYTRVMRLLEHTDDVSLYTGIRKRLEALDKSVGSIPDEFGSFIQASYEECKWAKGQKKQDISRRTQSCTSAAENGVLTEDNGHRFDTLWWPLLDFVYQKRISKRKKKVSVSSMDKEISYNVAALLWDETSLIDEYIEEKGQGLLKEECEILRRWKKPVRGTFVLERNVKNGAILISSEDNKVYQVCGIKSSWQEMFRGYSMPILCEATLLPFEDVIISDGLVVFQNEILGENLPKEYNELYTWARKTGRIIVDL